MLKEPLIVASRRIASPRKNPQNIYANPRRNVQTLLSHPTGTMAELDTLDLTGKENVDVGKARTSTQMKRARESGIMEIERDEQRVDHHIQRRRTTIVSAHLRSSHPHRTALEGPNRSTHNAPPPLTDLAEESVKETPPVYSYKDFTPKGFVIYTRHEEEANDLIDCVNPGPVAMDLEWRVSYFRPRGSPVVKQDGRVAVVQIADSHGLIFVIQVNEMSRFPIRLQALIENPRVPKVGVNILNDGKKLFRDYGIMAQNLVELGSVAMVTDPSPVARRKIVSLAKLVEHYCRRTLLKGSERTSDWECPLTSEQLEYAANDAHASLMVYSELIRLSKLHSRPLDGTNLEQYTNHVTWSRGSSLLANFQQAQAPHPDGMRPQFLRAYEYWHVKKFTLEDMCLKLSLKSKGSYGSQNSDGIALKPATVISYIIYALQFSPNLQFDLDELIKLVQMDIGSWTRHSHWISQQKPTSNDNSNP